MRRRIIFAIVLICAALAATGIFSDILATHSDPASLRADAITIDKSARTLSLLRNGKVLKTYRVALGKQPIGHKLQEGDGRTPEGTYRIDGRNSASDYYLALHISYPAPADIARARRDRVSPGGDIMIHGMKNGLGWLGPLHRLIDWTNGCIAVTNREMLEIWRSVPNNTAVDIRP